MGNKIDKFETQNDWDNWVDKTIEKHSGKPFKSGAKKGTVSAVKLNPYSGKKAFEMAEDSSIVDCHQCKLAE